MGKYCLFMYLSFEWSNLGTSFRETNFRTNLNFGVDRKGFCKVEQNF